MAFISHLLHVSSTDPDDARRGRLLNILLFSMAVIVVSGLIVVAILHFTGIEQAHPLIFPAGIIMLVGLIIIYGINRYWLGWVASTLFLLLFITVMAFSDEPVEVVRGRSLFLFTIPILMASVILRSYASFIIAALIDVLLAAMAISLSLVPNFIVMLGFFAIALVSWLSARSMEQALAKLRVVNKDLDRRVAERTKALKKANEQLQQKIVESQQSRQALILARDQALQASRFKSEILARVSHELRTPLGAILGFAEMLESGFYGSVSQQQRETLQKIIERNKNLTKLVGDLLDQAHLEAGKPTLDNVDFSPTDLVEKIQTTVEVWVREKGLKFTTEIAPEVPPVLCGDPTRLQQILLNLVGNAIKFTDQGRVHLSVFMPDENEYWAFRVSDTGPGIPAEAQPHIFDAFRQVDGSVTRDHAGFGLGLSIVKQLATLMGGEIQLESQPGKGSAFTVTLPRMPAQENRNE